MSDWEEWIMFHRPRASMWMPAAIFAVAYFAAAEFGHAVSLQNQDRLYTTFWPPIGLLLTTLAVSRYAMWLPLLLAACVASLTSDVLFHDVTVGVSIGLCAASTLQACVGAWLLRRLVGPPFTLANPRDVVVLVCFAAALPALVGALLAAWILLPTDGATSYLALVQSWWRSNTIAVIVVAPVILTWSANPSIAKNLPSWRMIEGAILFTGLALFAEAVYGDWLPRFIQFPILLFPFIVWAGLRFGPRTVASAVLTVGLIAVWNSSHGRGPYAAESESPAALLLRTQGTLGMFSVCVLLLAATVSERRQAEGHRIATLAELQKALAEIKTLRGFIPICSWCKRIRDDQDFWHSVEDYIAQHTEATFSHGMCPACVTKAIDDLEREGRN
jgi:integral membrane sensor domain MASE1